MSDMEQPGPPMEKPEHKPGKPPNMEAEEGLTPGRRLRELDADNIFHCITCQCHYNQAGKSR